MRKRKKNLTLLEMTIALFLTGILLSALWGIYHHFSVSYQKAQKEQVKVHKLLFLKEKLDLIASWVSSSSFKEEKESLIFTPQNKMEGLPTLSLSYEHGPDPELIFNHFVRSLLYVNNNKTLCLATWASKGQMRVETLLDQVSSLAFSYFDPEVNLWRENWPESFDHTPLWIRIKIESEGSLELILRVSTLEEPIIYLKSLEELP